MRIVSLMIFAIFSALLMNCATQQQAFTDIKITPLLEQNGLNARSLTILDNLVYFAGAKGWVGNYHIQTKKLQKHQIDSSYNFRSIAAYADKKGQHHIYLLNIASPAYLWYGTDIHQFHQKLISNSPKAFYDALLVNENGEGFALGDPIDDCMSVLKIKNIQFETIPCHQFPKSEPNEAAFAASNSNIKILDQTVWMATGGAVSRMYKSENFGENWEVYSTPIIQGKSSQGIFSIDFYDLQNGIAIGGDYTKPEDKQNNLIRTRDGGKTWQLLNHTSHPGYRSCIQYMPKSKGNVVVAAGFKGIDISHDAGQTWRHISDLDVYTIQFLNKHTAFAAGKNGVYQLNFR